jgi:hypothetical protein
MRRAARLLILQTTVFTAVAMLAFAANSLLCVSPDFLNNCSCQDYSGAVVPCHILTPI